VQKFISQYYLRSKIKYEFEVVNVGKTHFSIKKYVLTIKLKIDEIV